ncbi:MAG: hypothetical protein JXL97_13025 [Bacteroidales bacterium]|nr:hypothetical protein [Bacteroidales bacterium]
MEKKSLLLTITFLLFSLGLQAQPSGYVLDFDGANDYVSTPRSISSDFTIEYWIKTTQVGASGVNWYNGNGIVDAEVGGVTNDLMKSANGFYGFLNQNKKNTINY